MTFNRIYLISGPRSGSSAFASYLNSHPRISFASGEFFQPRFVMKKRIYAKLMPKRYLDRSVSEACNTDLITGCKLMYYQLEQYRLPTRRLMSDRIRIIHLIRNNTFAQYVSLKESMRTRIWHSRGEPRDVAGSTPLYINLNEMKRFFSIVNERKERYSEALKNSIRVEYEKFQKSPDESIRHVFQELELENFPADSLFVKNKHRRYEDRISNFCEVRDQLVSIGMEHYLED